MRSAIRWTGRIALFVLLMASAVRFNGNVLDARLGHLDMLLERGSQSDTHSATELIGRYRLILRRMEEGEDSLAAFQTEAQLAALETEPVVARTGDEDESAQRERRDTVEHAVISLLRRLSGKPAIAVAHREAVIERIKDAYLSERRRDWATAINSYEAILAEEVLDTREIAVVSLHLGFSYSMNGEFDRARSTYNRVLADHPGTEEARSAAVLIESLRALVDARNALAESVSPPDTGDGVATRDSPDDGPDGQEDMERVLSRGRTAFLRLEYDEAITAFDALLQRSVPPEMEAEVRYYRARSLEERGDFTEATFEYDAVQSLPVAEATPWDERARRRTAMIGAFYTDGEVLDATDEPFLAVVERYGDILAEPEAPTLAAPGELPPGETVAEASGAGVDRSPIAGSADAGSEDPGSEEDPSPAAAIPSRTAFQSRETAATVGTPRADEPGTLEEHGRTGESDDKKESETTGEPGGRDGTRNRDDAGDGVPRPAVSSESPDASTTTDPEVPKEDPPEDPDAPAVTAPPTREDSVERLSGRAAAPAGVVPVDEGPADVSASGLGAGDEGPGEAEPGDERPADVSSSDAGSSSVARQPDRIGFLGSVLQDEKDGIVLILPEDDSAMDESSVLVIYRIDGEDASSRTLVATATSVGRVPPRLIARVRERFGDRTARAGDRVYVQER